MQDITAKNKYKSCSTDSSEPFYSAFHSELRWPYTSFTCSVIYKKGVNCECQQCEAVQDFFCQLLQQSNLFKEHMILRTMSLAVYNVHRRNRWMVTHILQEMNVHGHSELDTCSWIHMSLKQNIEKYRPFETCSGIITASLPGLVPISAIQTKIKSHEEQPFTRTKCISHSNWSFRIYSCRHEEYLSSPQN